MFGCFVGADEEHRFGQNEKNDEICVYFEKKRGNVHHM